MFPSIKSLFDLQAKFPTEQSCITHLEDLFWSGTPVSPFDANSKVYVCKNGKYKCKNSGKYFNVRTGTMYDNTKIELRKWFFAVWVVTSHKKGIASTQLAKDIDVTQKTAWFMLQRIRACFGIENYNELEGIVEGDESFYGGKNKFRHNNKKAKKAAGRNFTDKVPIVGLIQRGGKMTAIVVKNTSGEQLLPIVREFVKPGSVFVTDDWGGYNGLKADYDHRVIKDITKSYLHDYDPETHTNNIEGSWKHLKNCIRDNYNHVSRKHLQVYVDEFVFRFNLKCLPDNDKFNRLQMNCNVRTKYKDLTQN